MRHLILLTWAAVGFAPAALSLNYTTYCKSECTIGDVVYRYETSATALFAQLIGADLAALQDECLDKAAKGLFDYMSSAPYNFTVEQLKPCWENWGYGLLQIDYAKPGYYPAGCQRVGKSFGKCRLTK